MYKSYYEPSPGVIRSTGEAAISRYWEAADGSGMWVQSNYWGKTGTSVRTLGTKEYMQSIGGVEVEPDFWFFDRPIAGYIKFSDVRPMATKEP
jgi:hypothetical protein